MAITWRYSLPQELAGLGIVPDPGSVNGIAGVPPFNGAMHVSGLQALMKENDTLINLKNVIIPLIIRNSPFAKYFKPYNVLKALIERIKMKDEKIICDEKEAEQVGRARVRGTGKTEEDGP